MAAEPIARLDTRGASPWVRAYYAVWIALHGRVPGDVGCGLYGLSEEGRARFGEFPGGISDDGFVRAHFAPEEIELLGARVRRLMSATLCNYLCIGARAVRRVRLRPPHPRLLQFDPREDQKRPGQTKRVPGPLPHI